MSEHTNGTEELARRQSTYASLYSQSTSVPREPAAIQSAVQRLSMSSPVPKVLLAMECCSYCQFSPSSRSQQRKLIVSIARRRPRFVHKRCLLLGRCPCPSRLRTLVSMVRRRTVVVRLARGHARPRSSTRPLSRRCRRAQMRRCMTCRLLRKTPAALTAAQKQLPRATKRVNKANLQRPLKMAYRSSRQVGVQ